jgi:DNA topoisomerase-1
MPDPSKKKQTGIARCLKLRRNAKGRFVATNSVHADRVRRARVPPAYKNPCINADPKKKLLWTATDRTGRLQYRYTPEWQASAHARKYARLATIGRALARIRMRVARDLSAPSSRSSWAGDREVAAIIGILDLCRMRAGSRRYMKRSGVRGATTIDPKHLRGNRLKWTAKSGVRRTCTVTDSSLVVSLPGALGRVSARRLNEWLRPYNITTKDVRTWHANALYVSALRAGKDSTACVRVAAEGLGHTPAVCRRNYLDPRVLAAKTPNDLPSAPRRAPARLSKDEAVLLLYLK